MENIWYAKQIIDERNLHPLSLFPGLLFLFLFVFSLFFFLFYKVETEFFIFGTKKEVGDVVQVQFLLSPQKMDKIEKKKLYIEKKQYSYELFQMEYRNEKEVLVTLVLFEKPEKTILKMNFRTKKETLIKKCIRFFRKEDI